jgi:hypothetical protein
VIQYDRSLPTFQRNLLPPSSGQNKKPGMKNNCMDNGRGRSRLTHSESVRVRKTV